MRTAILADVQDITDGQMSIVEKYIEELNTLEDEL